MLDYQESFLYLMARRDYLYLGLFFLAATAYSWYRLFFRRWLRLVITCGSLAVIAALLWGVCYLGID